MKGKIARLVLGMFLVLSLAGVSVAQVASSPAAKSSKFALEFGLGLGGYYGTLGGKISVSTDRLGLDLGLGLGPLAKGVSVDAAAGVSYYFKDRYAALRPKVSLFVSNIVYTVNVSEKSHGGVAEVLYQENFAGAGFLVGVDWRLGKSLPVCINVDLGYAYPFKGYSEVKRIKEAKVTEWRAYGYEIEDTLGSDTVTALDYVQFSLGLSFAIGRTPAGK